MKTNSQRQEQLIKPSVKPSSHFYHSFAHSLQILSMSNEQLFSHFRNIINQNPFIEYLPHKPHNEQQHSAIDFQYVEKTLQDDLFFQLETYRGTYSKKICSFIINSLDENGFLSYSYEEYCEFLEINANEFLKNLHIIQSFEPVGIAAINSIDSIKIQLQQDGQEFALDLFCNYQKEIMAKQYEYIAQMKNTTTDEVMEAMDIIKETNPFPANSYQPKTFDYIYPDFIIEVEDYQLTIKQSDYGTISYSKDYYKDIQNDPILHQYFKDASILISDLYKRNSTLLLICNELATIQKDYLVFGKPLKRCTILELSKKLGMHSSTISRAIRNKYFEWNHQIFPLEYLLTAKKTKDLSDPIQKSILLLIAKENTSFPYSDYELHMLLKKQNISISRRTINKYRKIMGIENSYKRKEEYQL